jgi:aerobic C4-dicarboxylate transport protein
MSEARALTNFIGNGVATIVVARWENELDRDKLNHELANPPSATDLDDDLPSDHHAPLADKAA